jgi:hypothetical protein
MAEAPPPAALARTKRDASERESDAAPRVLGAARTRDAAGGLLSLSTGVRPRLDADASAEQVTLRIPVRAALRAGPIEVRVIDESGARELRERVAAAGDQLEMRVPRVWLVPGAYRVEVAAAGSASEADRFTFDVGR